MKITACTSERKFAKFFVCHISRVFPGQVVVYYFIAPSDFDIPKPVALGYSL
jgi:hypothetical protein